MRRSAGIRNMLRLFIAFWFVVSAFTTPASAAMTEWQDIGGGEARLIATLSPETGVVTAGLEIKLKKGWKTYWRQPGDSGIPPQLDFSASKGFLPGEILLPTPELIKGADYEYVGYTADPTFVFDGQIAGPAEQASINLNLFIGVCEEICIPAQASFTLPASLLNRSDAFSKGNLEIAMAQLPSQPTTEFRVKEAKKVSSKKAEISAQVPSGSQDLLLLTEGPGDWYFEPVRVKSMDDKLARFELDLGGIPDGENVGDTKLRFTLVSDGRSVEQWLAISE